MTDERYEEPMECCSKCGKTRLSDDLLMNRSTGKMVCDNCAVSDDGTFPEEYDL